VQDFAENVLLGWPCLDNITGWWGRQTYSFTRANEDDDTSTRQVNKNRLFWVWYDSHETYFNRLPVITHGSNATLTVALWWMLFI